MITTLVSVSLTFAIICFLIFAGFAVVKLRTEWALSRHARELQLPSTTATMDTKQQGLFEGADKLVEALAKLTDSLSKAPMPVVALIGAVLFLLVALGGSALGCTACAPKDSANNKRALVTVPERCVVGYFADADHHLPASIQDTPSGCLNLFAGALREGKTNLVLVIGRCDVRELSTASRQRYAENLSLAYQRAAAVEGFLLAGSRAESSSRIVLLTAGAAHVGTNLSAGSLRQDRVVELTAF